MTENNFKTTLENLLKTDTRLVDENNELKGNSIRDLANKHDEKLIELLLNNEKAKEHFFLKVKDVYVFKTNEFKFFLDENKIDNSYTQYENKIGLAVGSKFLKENEDVALNFPFKDCVLEGGQSTEDGLDVYFEFSEKTSNYEENQAKRKEIFYNEVLARDEIDRLFEPKAFTNIKKYSANEKDKIDKFERDENGIIKNNLIIKGNNLLALHSLKAEFQGKIKLIYIDPPYNTGKDGFQYNDNFSVSSWLTFMKNRLEIARELLSSDGIIFIQMDDKYKDYLKICCDEIFRIENFIANIIWKKRGGAPNDKVIGATHENILLYSKTEKYKLYKKPRTEEQKGRYSNPDNHPKGNWSADNLMANVKGGRGVDSLHFAIINPNTGEEHYPSSNGNWRYNQKTINRLLENDEIYFGKDGKGKPKLKRFYTDLKDEGVSIGTFWDDLPQNNSATAEILKLFGSVNEFDTPKPEKLIERIINIGSIEGDIVLDFFAGSGTTASVAHKMKRQFITSEQMNYIENVTLKRLKKVIEGENGGISEDVNWKGGGSFIYLELAKNNEQAKELILNCSNFNELTALFDELYNNFFLHYNVKIKDFKEKISKEENFIKLPFEKQKEMFCKMLDLNQMYVNVSEMEDSRYKLSENDIKLTKDFYQIKD
ncbi:MAG: hypothetical protein A2033_01690 [Bacteroidetes bacterium GWA2_31_9]|nr:MAG: hypothetical protein A2033_01690 [Bacteroidetes bacterium GWA2_31_9]